MEQAFQEVVRKELKGMSLNQQKDVLALVTFLAWRSKRAFIKPANPLVVLRGAVLHFYVRFMQLTGKA